MKTLLIVMFMLISVSIKNHVPEIQLQKTKQSDIQTIDDVYNFLVKHNCPNPKYFTALVMLESDNLQSNIAIQNKNITGMKFAKQRPTIAIREDNHCAVYNSFRDCLIDLMLWTTYTGMRNETDFYRHIWLYNYNRNPKYQLEIMKIYKQL